MLLELHDDGSWTVTEINEAEGDALMSLGKNAFMENLAFSMFKRMAQAQALEGMNPQEMASA
jgi:hypothetical protein